MRKGKFIISEEGQQRAINEFGDNYTSGQLAAKENFTNGLDACERARKAGMEKCYLEILVDPRARRVIVTDTGTGMDKKRLHELERKVLVSEKAERIDERGEKGVGLCSISYFGDGASVDIISRPQGQSDFGYIRWIKERGVMVPYTEEEGVSEKRMREEFYGSIERGTKAILNIPNSALFNENFKLKELKRFLRETYAPVLTNKEVPIYVGKIEGELECISEEKTK
jgi:DNA topoisomerase VI subunit B